MYVFLTSLLLILDRTLVNGLEFVETPPTELTLPEDSDLSLTCTTDPEGAVIGWYYKQTVDGPEYLLFEARRLVYQSVQVNYEGYYFCTATLDQNTIRSNATKLRIAYLRSQFVKVPSQVYTVEGSTVEFKCTPPDSYPDANVTWHKNSVPFSISRSYMQEDYTLVIVGILPEDSGDYQCVAYNAVTNETRVSLEGELYVTQQTDNDVEDNYEPPEASIASYFAAVDEGQSSSLLCAFQGQPYPSYSWYFENGTEVDEQADHRFSFQYEKQVLMINSASRDMAGVFQCRGTNIAGTASINVTIFVEYTEELGFREDIPEMLNFNLASVPSMEEVECKGMGSPPLTVAWYSLSGDLLSDSNILLINISQSQNITATCRVENRDGSMEQHTRVIVQEAPAPTERPPVTDERPIDTGGAGVEASVHCNAENMVLKLDTETEFSSLTLLDKGCEFAGSSKEIITPLDTCGTRAYYNDTHIIYKNQVRGTAAGSAEGSLISRGSDLDISFECSYKRTGSTADIEWEAQGEITVVVKGVGAFTFLLDMYEDETYNRKIDSSNYPVRVAIQDYIFLEVSILSPDEQLSLTVSDIVATDSPNGQGGTFSYSLVQDGCIVDSTFEYLESEDYRVKRFTLKAFHFLNSQSVVYLHAFVKICNITEDDSCSKLCTVNKRSTTRSRRSAGTHAEEEEEEFHIFQGPIVSTERLKVVSDVRRKKLNAYLLLPFLFLLILPQ